MDDQPLILVVDDDPGMCRFLLSTLSAQEYRAIAVDGGKKSLTTTVNQHPNLVLLDLGLPDIDGLVVARQLREWTQVPIIVISARDNENDKVAALDAGADDYLSKPFSVPELLARIRGALRRSAQNTAVHEQPVITIGELSMDLVAHRVTLAGNQIHLTPTEYQLLAILMRQAGKVITHNDLLAQVWGPTHVRDVQYLRVFMATLRHKLEPIPARPRYLLTELGVGYRLASE